MSVRTPLMLTTIAALVLLAHCNWTKRARRCQLQNAMVRQDLSAVRQLIEAGAPIEASDPDGRSPLFLASELHDWALTEELIARGARVNVTDRFGWKPLYRAILDERVDIMTRMIDAGADATDTIALEWAIKWRCNHARACLMAHGADENVSKHIEEWGEPPRHPGRDMPR